MAEEVECQHDDGPSCSALARKRRRELRQQRADDSEMQDGSKRPRRESEAGAAIASAAPGAKPKPSIVGIKRQARYEPGVPMTKEELVAWRKEARRVRNRESAAASRKKTRDRIIELEGQLDGLRSKYDAAMERILELESMNASLMTRMSYAVQAIQTDDDCGQSSVVSPCSSAAASPQNTPSVSPISSPRSSFVLGSSTSEEDSHEFQVENKVQHIIEMISRPNA